MGYSFDKEDNVTISGNFTLSEADYGMHNVTIYAKDLLWNQGVSETINFTVIKAEQITPWLVGVIITVIVIVFVSVILYKNIVKKRVLRLT